VKTFELSNIREGGTCQLKVDGSAMGIEACNVSILSICYEASSCQSLGRHDVGALSGPGGGTVATPGGDGCASRCHQFLVAN